MLFVPTSQVIADARRLPSRLSPLPTPEAMPAVIVVSGLPGAGKSSFSRRRHYVVDTLIDITPAIDK